MMWIPCHVPGRQWSQQVVATSPLLCPKLLFCHAKHQLRSVLVL
jgi:hypothetical protein